MEQKSYMLVVPKKEEDLMDLDGILSRLRDAQDFKLGEMNMQEEKLYLEILYQGSTFQAEVYPTTYSVPEMYRIQHFFSDIDVEEIQKSENGLAVELDFGENALQSYHLQLKLIDTILPEKLAVFDDSSEKVLSGKWVALAARSDIPPAPRYLYTVQAVYNEDEDCVWLHSHGLNRCNLTELEILDSHKETYQEYYNVIETMANRMLELDEPLHPYEPLFLANLGQGYSLVTTYVPWEDAIGFYDKGILGGREDRKESHNQDTSLIFLYLDEESFKKGQFAPVSVVDDLLIDNPMYMFTLKETERMKALAKERLAYVKTAMKQKDVTILVKLGLEVDEEYKTKNNSHEHIWFELKEITDQDLTAMLTQEPYYVSGIKKGDIRTYSYDAITDWLILTPQRRLTPDDAYMLESE